MKSEQLNDAKIRYNELAQEQMELVCKIEDAKKVGDSSSVKKYKAQLENCRKLLGSLRKIIYS